MQNITEIFKIITNTPPKEYKNFNKYRNIIKKLPRYQQVRYH